MKLFADALPAVSILEVLDETSHPVGIVTKSALVTRDIDILARMAKRNLVKVALSVTTLDRRLARAMEPLAVGLARDWGATWLALPALARQLSSRRC